MTFSISLHDKWESSGGRPSGFDVLRVTLSLSILLFHTACVCYGRSAETLLWVGPLRPVVYALVPAFFALSGFLVAGSLGRNDIVSFLTLRVIRIFPALVAEVLLSGLLIGAILTRVPLSEYFTSKSFFEYFLNTLGWIHYYLPGVFTESPAGTYVNVQLWTVPFELQCYIALSAAALIGLTRRPVLFFVLVLFFIASLTFRHIHGNSNFILDDSASGRMIVVAFLFGVLLFLMKEKIVFSFRLFALAVVIWSFLVWRRDGVLIASLPIAYITIYIGLLNPKWPGISKAADYSYGLYLYGFPVQQVVTVVFPDYRIWYVNFALSLVLAGFFAFLSWHYLEKKVLARRKKILGVVSGLRSTIEFQVRIYQARFDRGRRRFAVAAVNNDNGD